MIEVIKFDLSANMAIIKKPESNETYFTYNFPHKIMILGLLGAIIGLNGYNYYALKKYLGEKVNDLPEFYEKLKDLKISVIPKIKGNNFNKKIQTFNNSIGYASGEKGNNLVVQEQWLEKPYWQIYILNNNTVEYEKIKDYLINKKCEYIPYIGKNDHFAKIDNVEILKLSIVKNQTYIDSLFEESILLNKSNISNDIIAFEVEEKQYYNYKEILPTQLNEKVGYHNFKAFIYTNYDLKVKENTELYKLQDDRVIYFY